jgi:hypothetical protein
LFLLPAAYPSPVNTWYNVTVPANSPSARYEHAMAYDIVDNRVVMFGGLSSGANVADTWLYNYSDNTWYNVTVPANSPSARNSPAMAYDIVDNRVVMFGGIASLYYADTWLYNYSDGKWYNVTNSSASPSARYGAAMAYDIADNRVVMYGGYSSSGTYLSDTWLYNYSDGKWYNVNVTAGNAGARYAAAMAYDIADNRIVMHGGYTGSTFYADTWIFNFSASANKWYNVTNSSASPSARYCHAMAYDIADNRVVLFGGYNTSSNGFFADTWLFNYSDLKWYNVTVAANSPDAVYLHAMAYDLADNQVVMFGGTSGAPTQHADTWLYNLTLTTPIPAYSSVGTNISSPAPGNAVKHYAYWTDTSGMSLYKFIWRSSQCSNTSFGASGWSAVSSSWSNNTSAVPSNCETGNNITWVMLANDTNRMFNMTFGSYTLKAPVNKWYNVTPATSPIARALPAIDYDLIDKRIVMFGGCNMSSCSTSPLNETWVYNYSENKWYNVTSATSPIGRMYHGMVYDLVDNRFVMYGGMNGSSNSFYGDTWLFNVSDSKWYNVTNNFPGLRYAYMAYDLVDNRVVMFGGKNASASYLGDTWLFNYSDLKWYNVTPATSPSARTCFAMAYDLVDNRVVIFGGQSGAGYLADTWVYNYSENKWYNVTVPANSPIFRYWATMAYDLADNRIVLFGGYSGSGSSLSDTWIFNFSDSKWYNMTVPTNLPPVRYENGIAYDLADNRIVMYGGNSAPGNDTWLYNLTLTTPIPAYSSTGTNVSNPSAGSAVSHYAYWTDSLGMSLYRFIWQSSQCSNTSFGAAAWAAVSSNWANTTMTLPSNCAAGNNITWLILANDTNNMFNMTYGNYTVSNNPPSISSLQWNNTTAVYPNSAFSCNATTISYSANNPQIYYYIFNNNSGSQALNASGLVSVTNGTNAVIYSVTNAGNAGVAWICSLTPYDGSLNGTQTNSTTLVVSTVALNISSIGWNNTTTVYPGFAFSCNATVTSPTNSTPQVYYSIFNNNSGTMGLNTSGALSVTNNTNAMVANITNAGNIGVAWICSVTPNNGATNGTQTNSTTLIVHIPPPAASSVIINVTSPPANGAVLHSAFWTASSANLSGYVFSWNGTWTNGTWTNDSWVAFSQTNNSWSNVTKTEPSSDTMVAWMIYANDTAVGSWGGTPQQLYNVTTSVSCSVSSLLGSVNFANDTGGANLSSGNAYNASNNFAGWSGCLNCTLYNMSGAGGTSNVNWSIQGGNLSYSSSILRVGNLSFAWSAASDNDSLMYYGNSTAMNGSFQTIINNVTPSTVMRTRLFLNIPLLTQNGNYAGNFTIKCCSATALTC